MTTSLFDLPMSLSSNKVLCKKTGLQCIFFRMETTKSMTSDFLDRDNPEQQAAYDMIEKTSSSFFLAGRAGTGKTTFLRRIQEESSKSFIVLAPTGVAAINAGGQTIHSFFGFNFGVLPPGYIGYMNEEKIGIIRHIDGIIIDEVSMVRCDVMDAIDRTLRHYRKSFAPFGGLQMVLVGDMFQLEPITTAEDKVILKDFYPSDCYYFYKSMAIGRMPLPKIEFRKIYRQNDPGFIRLLEHLRVGRFTYSDLARINGRVTPEDRRNRHCVTLTARREDARAMNETRLNELQAEPRTYDVIVEGDCRRLSEAVEEHLTLKVGAQVMLTKNDRDLRWVNGTVGEVTCLDDDTIKVRLEDGTEHSVEHECWDFVEYEYDKDARTCEKKVVGKAYQYPLRLAWAITIHKSQSLTFNHVAVDFGRRAFSNGQAYVALSRACSLEGLELVRPMTFGSVMVSKDVISFSEEFNDRSVIDRELAIGSAVEPLLRQKDFDGIAVRLFGMSRDAVRKGDYALARDLMCRTMSYVADDTCLEGQEWDPVTAVSRDTLILNATGLFYAGQRDRAEAILTGIGADNITDVNALYILARCLECREDWDNVEKIYDRLATIHNNDMELGVQSPDFRKIFYRVACLNESVYGEDGLKLLQRLMGENLTYEPYNLALRKICFKHDGLDAGLPQEGEPTENEGQEDSKELVERFLDRRVSDGEFLELLRQEKASPHSEALRAYRKFVRELKFEEPRI